MNAKLTPLIAGALLFIGLLFTSLAAQADMSGGTGSANVIPAYSFPVSGIGQKRNPLSVGLIAPSSGVLTKMTCRVTHAPGGSDSWSFLLNVADEPCVVQGDNPVCELPLNIEIHAGEFLSTLTAASYSERANGPKPTPVSCGLKITSDPD